MPQRVPLARRNLFHDRRRLLAALGGVVFSGRASGGALSLRAACREASRHNRGVLAGRLRADAARQRGRQARAQYWPTLTVSERFLRTDDPGVVSTLAAAQNRPIPRDRPSWEDVRAQAELRYLVYGFGRRAGAVRAADHAHAALERGVEGVRSRMLLAVVDAYCIALQAREEMGILAEEAERMEQRLALAENQIAAGRGLASDRAAAEYHLQRIRQEHDAAALRRENAAERLGYLLGRPDGALGEDLATEEPDLAAAVAALDSPRSAVRAAVISAPAIARQQQLLLAGEATLETRRADRWPQLEAVGRVTRNGERFGDWDAEQDSYLVGLTLSWDLFDGGLRESRVREARRELDARRMELSDAERQVSLRAREAWRALRDARQARVVADKRLAYHRAAHEERELGHQRGRASFQDLLEAESDVAASRLAESRAELLVKRAAAELMDAAGLWDAWLDAAPGTRPNANR